MIDLLRPLVVSFSKLLERLEHTRLRSLPSRNFVFQSSTARLLIT